MKKGIKAVKSRYTRVQILCNMGFSIRGIKLIAEGEIRVVFRESLRERSISEKV